MATSFVASVVQMILIATVAIPLLTALGVLSGGSVPAMGVGVVASSLAASSSMSAGVLARAEGGLIPGPSSDRDNRMAMVATGEYVARSRAVSYYGAAMFEAINSMRIPKERLWEALNGYAVQSPNAAFRTAYADGGLVAQAPAQQTNVNVAPTPLHVAVLNSRSEFESWARSTPGTKTLIDIFNQNKHAIGIRS
jgi:hypothetical protein